MLAKRVIPCLLLSKGGLVKTTRFKKPIYLGEPVNIVKIFNDKCADEIVFLDIDASRFNQAPDFRLLERIASEAFMPLAYGGGVRSVEDCRHLYEIGFEKIIINSEAGRCPEFVEAAVEIGGSSGIVGVLDIKKNWMGKYGVYINGGSRRISNDIVEYAETLERLGVGEIIINSIEHDGKMAGYNNSSIQMISDAVSVPTVALGGAGNYDHFRTALRSGASAVAAGSLFVFHGRHKAVLITYPDQDELRQIQDIESQL